MEEFNGTFLHSKIDVGGTTTTGFKPRPYVDVKVSNSRKTDRQTDRLNIDGPDRKTKKNQQIYKNGDKTQM